MVIDLLLLLSSRIVVGFSMLTSDFAAATVLISFGAVLGKLSCIQLVVMAMVEIAIYSVNEYIGVEIYEVRLVFSVLYTSSVHKI